MVNDLLNKKYGAVAVVIVLATLGLGFYIGLYYGRSSYFGQTVGTATRSSNESSINGIVEKIDKAGFILAYPLPDGGTKFYVISVSPQTVFTQLDKTIDSGGEAPANFSDLKTKQTVYIVYKAGKGSVDNIPAQKVIIINLPPGK